jgi:hypothetical protein
MRYIKATHKLALRTLLMQGVALSTAPELTYPLPEEFLLYGQTLASAPSRSALHQISSTREWWAAGSI